MSRLDILEKAVRKARRFSAFVVLWPGDELTPETKVSYHVRGAHCELPLGEFQALFPGGDVNILRVEYVEN